MELERSDALAEDSRLAELLRRLAEWRPQELEVRDKTLSASEVIQLASTRGLQGEKDALLKVVLRLDLPREWRRERDPQGNFQYTHVMSKVTTSQHPTVLKMRQAFLEMLKLSKLPDKAQLSDTSS